MNMRSLLSPFPSLPLPADTPELFGLEGAKVPIIAPLTARERAFKKVLDHQAQAGEMPTPVSGASWDVDGFSRGAGESEPIVGLPAREATLAQEQAALREVLYAYSTLDTDVGYCQGMNFVAAVLLRHFPQEVRLCVYVEWVQ